MTSLIEKIVNILEKSETLLVPVKKLWTELKEESTSIDGTIEEFIRILDEDQRFRVFRRPTNPNTSPCESILTKEEMEAAGFCQGPWVILRDRIPDQGGVVESLIEKADRTFETLKNAWEIRPRGNEVIEDQLLFALAKTQQLQNELRMIFGEKKS